MTHIKSKRKKVKKVIPKRLLPPGATAEELLAEIIRLNPKGDKDG